MTLFKQPKDPGQLKLVVDEALSDHSNREWICALFGTDDLDEVKAKLHEGNAMQQLQRLRGINQTHANARAEQRFDQEAEERRQALTSVIGLPTVLPANARPAWMDAPSQTPPATQSTDNPTGRPLSKRQRQKLNWQGPQGEGHGNRVAVARALGSRVK